MNGIEREIIKTTNYKVLRKFDDRQDYLMSLLNATEKLSDDDFDNLSSEAAEWVNAAVEAHNSKNQDIPDFDEVPPEEDDGADDSEESNDDNSSGDDQPAGDEAETEPVEGEATDETDDTRTEPEAEPAEEKPAKRKGGRSKKAKAVKEPKEPKKPVHAKREPTTYVKPKVDPLKRGSDEDVVLDKWGTMEGSKNSRALAMFEKGATTNEVRVKLDGTYYNILKKMVENGHKVEKVGSMITLTHRDAAKRPKK